MFNELNDKSLPNVKKAVGFSTLICCLGYTLVALVGVLTFGNHVGYDDFNGPGAANYLYVFPMSHYVITVLSFGLIVVITLLYAVLNYPFVKAVKTCLKLALPQCLSNPFLAWQHSQLVLTLVGMVIVVFVNTSLKNISTLFSLSGGWGCAFVCYCIPSILVLKDGDQTLTTKTAMVASLLLVALVVLPFTDRKSVV